MHIKERQLRIYGYLLVAFIFYFFFMLEMFFSWHDNYMWLKTIGVTVLVTLAIWEPVRFFILQIRKRWPGLKRARCRAGFTIAVVFPYAFLIGFLKIYLEHTSNLWGVPVATISAYSYTIGICLLFCLLQIAVYEGIYLFEEWNKSKTEAEELRKLNFQIQFDSLKVQIQPHFLFNTLNTLIGLMNINIPRAIQFTEGMAHVYRYLLEANDRQLISLDEEMTFATSYFFLLKTRYSDGLHLEISQEYDLTKYQLPPLSLQVLIENAVKHNIITRDKPLFIKIELYPLRQLLTVSNNLQRKPRSYHSTGVGLKHLRKKFELLHIPVINIAESEHTFSVTIPLINSKTHASSNY